MFVVSFIVLALLQPSLQQEIEVPGILQNQNKQSAKRTLLSSDVQSCDGTRMFSTCSNCHLVNICLGNTMDQRYCPSVTPDKPFCNNGECSATLSADFDCPWSMYCTGVGYFPDPRSCESYHYCEQKDSLSLVYKCPEGFILNPDTFLCKRKQKAADCTKIVCNPNEIFSSYGSSKRFFAYCLYDKDPASSSIKMYKCSDGTEFDGKSCVYQCSAEGRFPDSVNERTYYECYDSGDVLMAAVQICPYGTSFNKTLATCIRMPTTTTTVPTTYLPSTTLSTTNMPTTNLPTTNMETTSSSTITSSVTNMETTTEPFV